MSVHEVMAVHQKMMGDSDTVACGGHDVSITLLLVGDCMKHSGRTGCFMVPPTLPSRTERYCTMWWFHVTVFLLLYSGTHIYQPVNSINGCRMFAIRLNCMEFQPSRSQRKVCLIIPPETAYSSWEIVSLSLSLSLPSHCFFLFQNAWYLE